MNLHSILRDDTFLNDRQFVEKIDNLGRSIEEKNAIKYLIESDF